MAENVKTYTFVISEESINSYGFRVLSDGIDTTFFLKNPIAFWVHSRPSGWDKQREPLPIGRWENLRREGSKWLADLVFDEDDEFAMQLRGKVDKGIINMASAGLRVIATSEDPSVLLKGQTRPTVVQSFLLEISLVDIGSNRNALRLQDEFGTDINLSDRDGNHLLPLLSDIQHLNNDMELQEQIIQVLKLSDKATPAEILLACQTAAANSLKLADLQGQVTTLTTAKSELEVKLKGFEDAEKAAEETKRVELVDGAIASKKITAAQKETYLKFAEADFEGTKTILDGMKGVTELGDNTSGGEVKLSAWAQRQKEINENLKKNR